MNDIEKMSYALGMNIAGNISELPLEIDTACLLRALSAVLAGQPAPGRHAIRMAVIADWNNNTTSDKFIARAVKNINQRAKRAGHSQTTQAALISHVSGYAQTDTGEALAECVADYVANGQNARRLSREVWRLLKKELT